MDLNGQTTTWAVGDVLDHQFHPVLFIDEPRHQVLIVSTSPDEGGGLYLTATSYDDPRFEVGRGHRLVLLAQELGADHALGSKQDLNAQSGLVVLGSDEGAGRYVVGASALGGKAPDQPAQPAVGAARSSGTGGARRRHVRPPLARSTGAVGLVPHRARCRHLGHRGRLARRSGTGPHAVERSERRAVGVLPDHPALCRRARSPCRPTCSSPGRASPTPTS